MQNLLGYNHEEFTVKRDFNMTGFILNLKPDEAFVVNNVSEDVFERTNSSSNIKLKNNMLLSSEDVIKLIEANRKVIVYYAQSKRLLCFNFGDSFEERFRLAKKVGEY